MTGFDGDDTARLFFLLILALAGIGGVIRLYRHQLGEGLQAAAVWALIFAGAVIVYGFRDQLGANLFPRTARQAGEAIVLTRDPDGHFYAEIEVDGVPVVFIVDTGATEVVLGPDDAQRIGLDPSGLSYTREAMTANGIVRGAPVRLGELRLADHVTRDVDAVVNEAPLSNALLGMGFLNRFASLRIEGETLTLVP